MDPRLYPQLREIERTHWWYRGRRRVIEAAIARSRVAPRTVLDVGCGAGTNFEMLRGCLPNARLRGIDIEHAPLSFCAHEQPVPVIQADVGSLPFPDGSFDLVAALDSLEHVPDDAAVLRELRRVCAPGGGVVLSVPAFPILWGNVDEYGHHFRRYRRAELESKVVAAGFDVQSIGFFNYLLFPPIAAIRLLARWLPRREPEDPDSVRTDFDVVKSGPLNSLLAAIFSLEAALPGLRPPFGVSLLCIARLRNGGAEGPPPGR